MFDLLKKIFAFTLLLIFVFIPRLSQAIEPIMNRVPAECLNSGTCSLNDMFRLAVSLSDIIISIIGSVVLLFFIYGGVVMLTSAGNKERVTKGRRIILGALTGLAFIFFSYSIIAFVAKTFGYTAEDFTSE